MKCAKWWMGWLAVLSLGFGFLPEAMAASELVENIRWKYTVADGKAKIDGGGWDSPAIPSSTRGDISIPAKLGGYPVTGIGVGAFYQCSGLTSLTIPDGVTSIEWYAFHGCSGLTNMTIPDGVVSIGDRAFQYCSSLASVLFPDSVTSIGVFALEGCSGLASVTLPNSGTSIGDGVFQYCNGLTSVTIPGRGTSIGNYAFRDCSGLTSVTIGDGVARIGEGVFSGCASELFDTNTISGVWLVDGWAVGNSGPLNGPLDLTGIRGIAENVFSGCNGLTSVTISDSMTRIGSLAFEGCSGLTAVHIHDLAAWCGISFDSNDSNPLTMARHLYLDGEEVAFAGDFVIPDGATGIGNYVFLDCTNLTSVIIPDSVTNIGEGAFEGCSGLTSVAIPDKVASIGARAFYNCSGLTWLIIPESVTNVGNQVFGNCSGLTILYVPEAWRGTSMLASAGVPKGCNVIYGGAVEVIDGVLWAFLKNGQEATVLAMSGLSGDILAVPPVLGGCTVTGVEAPFGGFTNVTRVVLPSSVTNIAPTVFRGCSGLTSVVVPQCVCATPLSKTFPDSYCGIAEIEICDGVELVGEGAFAGCTSLKSISIPASVASIGACALEGCSALESVSIPPRVVCIEQGTFRGCEALQSVEIPNGITRIGEEAFAGCVTLAEIWLPEGVAHIGERAFMGCTALTTARIRSSSATRRSWGALHWQASTCRRHLQIGGCGRYHP